jgi:hypothetical protein
MLNGLGARESDFNRTRFGTSRAVLVVMMAIPRPDSTAAIKLFTPIRVVHLPTALHVRLTEAEIDVEIRIRAAEALVPIERSVATMHRINFIFITSLG